MPTPAHAVSHWLNLQTEVLEQIADAVILVDGEERVRIWNRAASERYGVPAAEVLGKRLSEVIQYRFDSEAAEQSAWAILQEQGRWRGETTHIGRDGREWRVESAVTAMLDETGNRVGLLAVIRDVTEVRRRQTRLEASERKFRGIFENAATGISISDRAGRLEDCNQAYCAWLGYTKAELMGRLVSGLLYPDDRERNIMLVERVLSGEMPSFEVETRYIHKSGKPIWGRRFVSVAEEEDGRPSKLLALVTNISGMRRAAEDARFLLRLDHAIAGVSGARELASEALRLLGEHFQADRCSFSEFDPLRDSINVSYQWKKAGPAELGAYQLRQFYLPEVIAALKAGETVAIADLATDARTAAFAPRFAAEGFRAIVQTAYLRDGKPVALLAVISSSAREWEAPDLHLLHEFASRVWPAVERACVAGQLARSEERLRLAAQASGFGIRDLDAETGASFWSPEMYDILGLPRGSDASQQTLLAAVHPFDRERVAEHFSKALDPTGSGEFDLEFRVVRASDGDIRWVHKCSKTFFSGEGGDRRAVRSTGILIDITARKQTEQALAAAIPRLNALIENSPIAIVHLDSELRITRWSREAEALFGWTAAEVLDRGVEEFPFIYPDDLDTVHRVFRGFLDGTQPRASMVYRNHRKDGSVIECEWHSSTIYDRDGGLDAVLCHVLDLTEKRLTEKHLREAQKTESIAVLAGGIAHDFNNLLTAVIGYASLARESVGTGHAAQNFIERITRSANEAARLTRQMLAYAGKGSVLLERVNVSGVIHEVSEIARAATPRSIRIRVEAERERACMRADRAQIQQVILSLVTNAAEAFQVDAGPMKEPAEIVIRSGHRTLSEFDIVRADISEGGPGRYVYVEVSDTGCGMSEQIQSRMFDPFFTTKFQGRGLGLAAVAGIVRAHGGALYVTSTVGRGTSVTALFPDDEPAET